MSLTSGKHGKLDTSFKFKYPCKKCGKVFVSRDADTLRDRARGHELYHNARRI